MTAEQIIREALKEDIGSGDHSSLACIDADAKGTMKLLAKQQGVVAGIAVAKQVLHEVDPAITMNCYKNDGDEIQNGDVLFLISGSKQKMLTAERTILNFMQRMSGIATTTREYVNLIRGTHAILLDTRKTTPNMRVFEKEAVKIGGGENHRFGLYDMIMLKDNHIDFAGGIEKAVDTTCNYLASHRLSLKIEIETRNLDEVKRVLKHGKVDRIMLDNFSPALMKEALHLIDGRFQTEASGGITKENIRQYAETGVDFISVGALTHQIFSLDMSLKSCC